MKHTNLIRTQIYFSEKERTFLKKEADELGISFSEIIRRILDKHIEEKEE